MRAWFYFEFLSPFKGVGGSWADGWVPLEKEKKPTTIVACEQANHWEIWRWLLWNFKVPE